MVFQIITGKSQSYRVLGNYLNLYLIMLITDSHLKRGGDDNDPYQAGFKSISRTTDNIFILCAIIDKQRCLYKPLYTCFVDFTKAVDYIDRTALYYKLLNRGIDGNLLNVIRSMFSKAECRVKWDSLKSEYGVLQGGMLSPKLFTEFLQDISATFDQDQGIPVDTLLMVYLLFANDIVLFSESAEGLQKQLTALYLYASLWHIIVGIPKTKVLIFNERYTKVRRSFHYGNNIIKKKLNNSNTWVWCIAPSLLITCKKLFLILLPKLGKHFFLYVNSPVLWSVNCQTLLRSRHLIVKYCPY